MDLPGVTISATRELETATREADVISCATMSEEPLIMGEWLKPGAHLDLVGSYLTDMREADDDAMRRGSVFTCCDRGRDEVFFLSAERVECFFEEGALDDDGALSIPGS